MYIYIYDVVLGTFYNERYLKSFERGVLHGKERK